MGQRVRRIIGSSVSRPENQSRCRPSPLSLPSIGLPRILSCHPVNSRVRQGLTMNPRIISLREQ